jgi:ribA/ribD-fused uncharacterized protein
MDLDKKEKKTKDSKKYLKEPKEKKARVSKKEKKEVSIKVSKVKTMKHRDYSKMTKKEGEILKTRRNCIQRFRGKIDHPLEGDVQDIEEMEPIKKVKEVKEKKIKEVKEKKVKEVKEKKVNEVKEKKVKEVKEKKLSKTMQFHSKAKLLPKNSPFPTTAMRDLSNFSSHDVEYKGEVYPTVEHAYQGQKYTCTKKPELVEMVRNLKTPEEAKSAGGKSGMKKNGANLDIECWNKKKMDLMRELIDSKIERHPEIKEILRIAKREGIQLVHFSRTDMEWGAHVEDDGTIKKGDNLLGEM